MLTTFFLFLGHLAAERQRLGPQISGAVAGFLWCGAQLNSA